ncbi:MAG: threonine/serine exporter family protein [Eubacteriales bacterium]|nr:threonine/serine exporter family protein [Eubacteriales bacterium]
MDRNIVSCALDIGERMLRTGGEVSRVEDTIQRILTSYGYVSVDVFTITSQIQVTAVDADGQVEHQFRRVYQWGTDLDELERLNQLSRDICAEKPEPEQLKKRIRELRENKPKQPGWVAYLGAVMAASGFCVFFGGSAVDALGTAVLACAITYMNHRSHTRSENKLGYYFFYSVVTGIIGYVMSKEGIHSGIDLDLDKMLIGCIMLTIPGISLTYAVRDMLLGETITGLLRFIDSLLIAASIAFGYMLISLLFGG